MIFDRKWFNRLYIRWCESVYDRDPELAKELDKIVVSSLGKRMAEEIKNQIPKSQNTMDYLYNALRESHWFQENVELVEKSDNEMVLQVRDCSWQSHWMKKYQELYPCVDSHKAFLEEFCREIDPDISIENLVAPVKNPEDGVYCRWKIVKKGSIAP